MIPSVVFPTSSPPSQNEDEKEEKQTTKFRFLHQKNRRLPLLFPPFHPTCNNRIFLCGSIVVFLAFCRAVCRFFSVFLFCLCGSVAAVFWRKNMNPEAASTSGVDGSGDAPTPRANSRRPKCNSLSKSSLVSYLCFLYDWRLVVACY